jgi:hypothetical protein
VQQVRRKRRDQNRGKNWIICVAVLSWSEKFSSIWKNKRSRFIGIFSSKLDVFFLRLGRARLLISLEKLMPHP